MKLKFILLSILFLTLSISCKNDDDNNCESDNSTCYETAPTNEACLAFFTRWFYNKESNSCQQISYSGCSEKGFETKQACDACLCD